MREIEVKARLEDPAAIVDKLAALGYKLSATITQHDLVFGLPGVPGASNNNEPWLRIRIETDATGATINYLTLKRSVTSQLDSIEHEVLVGDETELANIIKELGFVPYSDITKTRRKAHQDAIEICVDHVETLGDFIEAEMLCADDIDQPAVVNELWELFKKLGISKEQQVTDGYDVLVNRQLGKV